MRKIVLLLFIFSGIISAQEKYLIYFRDKGSLSKNSLSKSNLGEIAEQYLSKRSIERRKKTLGSNYFTYQDFPLENTYIRAVKDLGIKIDNKLKWFNAVSAYLSKEQISELTSLNFVEKIEKIRGIKANKPINGLYDVPVSLGKYLKSYSQDYGSSFVQNDLSDIPAVHDMGISGQDVVVGVFDTGFDWNDAESISNNRVIAEYDFVENDPITEDETQIEIDNNFDSHGTAVLSIIGGNSSGNLIGPAYSSKFLLAKTEHYLSETHAEEDNWAAAIEWMDSIGVDITNTSLGYSEFDDSVFSYTYQDMDGNSSIITKAAELAFERGITIITSAGNEGNKPWYYITAPADGFNVITVGAVNSLNRIASFSSRGPTADGRIKPEITALGVSVVYESPVSKNRYLSGNGTSYSGPIATGIASLLLSAHPHLTNKQIRSIMIESGGNVDSPNNDIGYGLISALSAVTFPNLKHDDNSYTLNKIFDPHLNVDENSVELVLVDGSTYPMVKSGNVFQVTLANLLEGSDYQFYFNYKDSEDNEYRIPNNKNYIFEFGELLVRYGLIENRLPYLPFNPQPLDESVNEPQDLILSWESGDPDGDDLVYDVYFGTSENPPIVKSNHENTEFNPGILDENTEYFWKIIARDSKGNEKEGSIWSFTTLGNENDIPNNFYLYQNYPNPFNPSTRIEYVIPQTDQIAQISIKVYDILGNEIRKLFIGEKSAGKHIVEFNAEKLSSGVYFYQLKAGSFSQTRKLIIL